MMIERAFLGYAIHEPHGLAIRCCSWCPDRAQLEQWAAIKGCPITHGICPECSQKMMQQLLGEQPDPSHAHTQPV